MARIVELESHLSLQDYGRVAQLASAVRELRTEAERLVPELGGRTLWMLNSTAYGGGVAEMLPTQISLLRDLGIDARWAVIESEEARFFALTKHIHNLIHGEGDPAIDDDDRAIYDEVSRQNATALAEHIEDGSLVIVHDPQPAGTATLLKRERRLCTVWRCHIGLDERLPQTESAWRFLEPYVTPHDRAVFSAPEYIPGYLAGRASVIHPAIDPLSHKNRPLSIHKLVGVLCDSALLEPQAPMLYPMFDAVAERLQADGGWAPATTPEDLGLLFRPVVLQVSRWDRLKGFTPLLEAFVLLKRQLADRSEISDLHRRMIENARLVLAGPEPASVQDDPEATEVLEEIRHRYLELEPALQRDIAVLSLPMSSRKENALMVNALQRCATVVVQNSLREGFGLTATEAMWKGVAVLGTRAVGLRHQVRDGLDGRLVARAEDPENVANVLDEMLADEHSRQAWGRSGQHRAHHEFLIFGQLRRWLELLVETLGGSVAR